jgi:hypothetical protein
MFGSGADCPLSSLTLFTIIFTSFPFPLLVFFDGFYVPTFFASGICISTVSTALLLSVTTRKKVNLPCGYGLPAPLRRKTAHLSALLRLDTFAGNACGSFAEVAAISYYKCWTPPSSDISSG